MVSPKCPNFQAYTRLILDGSKQSVKRPVKILESFGDRLNRIIVFQSHF